MVTFLKDGLPSASSLPRCSTLLWLGMATTTHFYDQVSQMTHMNCLSNTQKQAPERKNTSRSAGHSGPFWTSPSVAGGQPGRRAASGRVRGGRARRARGFSGPPGRLDAGEEPPLRQLLRRNQRRSTVARSPPLPPANLHVRAAPIRTCRQHARR